MSPFVTFLVTLLQNYDFMGSNHSYPVKFAIKIPNDKINPDIDLIDGSSLTLIRSFLPAHVVSIGPVVAIEKIFGCHIVPSK